MLDLFELDKSLDIVDCHRKYQYLIDDNFIMFNERDILKKWTDGFVDRDGKIVKEFQTTFHSSLWEFYLHEFFKQSGHELNQSYSRPDFVLTNPRKICIEAVTANVKQNGFPESNRTFEDQLSMTKPPWIQTDFYEVLDEAIVRQSNAISYKFRKYIKEYSSLQWVKESPFVVATASYDQINYGREYVYPLMALLYGYYYLPEKRGYIYKNSIKKPGTNSDIEIDLFSKEEYRNVSAIIYSCTNTLGKLTALAISEGKPSLNTVYAIRENISETGPRYLFQKVSCKTPELLSDGLFIFHNPNARYPIDQNDFQSCTHFYKNENGLDVSGIITPLIARINTATPFANGIEPMIKEHLRLYNDKNYEEFYDNYNRIY